MSKKRHAVEIAEVYGSLSEDGKLVLDIVMGPVMMVLSLDMRDMMVLTKLGVLAECLEVTAEEALTQAVRKNPDVLKVLLGFIVEEAKKHDEDQIVQDAVKQLDDLESVLERFSRIKKDQD